MDYGSIGILNDKKEMTSAKNEVAESAQTEVNLMDDPEQPRGALEDMAKVNTGDSEGGKNISQGTVQADMETSHEVGKTSGELNREASISSDDIMRAGGFGARDDISSFLPVASDSTDFEASLRDAREYEDPQEVICRPGLGWTEPTK